MFEYLMVFLLGGAGYCLIEVLWRGFTHWSMAIAGGGALAFIYHIGARYPESALWQRCAAGGAYDHSRRAYRGVCREHTARVGSVGLLGTAAQLHGTDLGAVQRPVVSDHSTGGSDLPRGQEKVQKT